MWENLEFVMYTSFGEKLKKIWQDFQALNINWESPNMAYEWCREWWNTFQTENTDEFGYDKSLKIIICYKNCDVKAILPLMSCERKIWRFRYTSLELLGAAWGATYFYLLNEQVTEEDWKEILHYINANISYDVLWFSHVRDGSLLLKYGRSHFLLSGCPNMLITNKGFG